MSRMTKTLQSVKQGWKDQIDHLGEASPDLSSIEKDSIFQDDQSPSDGNPFHSTALEDDLSPVQTQQKTTPGRKPGKRSVAERAETPRRVSSTLRRQIAMKQGNAKQKGSKDLRSDFKTPSVPPLPARVLPKATATQLRKISEESDTPEVSESASASQGPSATGTDSEETDREALTDAGSAHSSPGRRKSQPVRRSQGDGAGSSKQPNKKPEAGAQKQPRKSSGKVALQRIPEEKDTPAPAEDAETDSDSLTDEDSVYVPPSKKKSRPGQRSQDDEDEEEEEGGRSSINPRGRKKSRSSSGGRKSQSRKSSSGSSDTAPGGKRRKQKVQNPIDLEVVLEAFQDFVEQYKETVDSNAVHRAIDHLSNHFVKQLTETITASKELTSVKKKNMKLNTATNSTRSKLVDAKNELIQSEARVRALEKEKKLLGQRVTDLTQAMTLLNGLTELHTKYGAYCEEHPDETHTYSTTSLPAMLLEARCMLGAEHQLQTVNAKLQQVLDSVDQK